MRCEQEGVDRPDHGDHFSAWLNAVVGVMGKVDESGQLTSIGITCALCHSNVDDSVTAGVAGSTGGRITISTSAGAAALPGKPSRSR